MSTYDKDLDLRGRTVRLRGSGKSGEGPLITIGEDCERRQAERRIKYYLPQDGQEIVAIQDTEPHYVGDQRDIVEVLPLNDETVEPDAETPTSIVDVIMAQTGETGNYRSDGLLVLLDGQRYHVSDLVALEEKIVEIRPPWEIFDVRPQLLEVAYDLLGELFTNASNRRNQEARAAATMEAAVKAGIPTCIEEVRMLSGAGRAAHEHRSVALAYATLLWVVDTSWCEGEEDKRVIRMARALLEAYQWGTGGGWSSPGEGTDRGVDFETLAEISNVLTCLGVPKGGGFSRRYAVGGEAWSAAAASASYRLGESPVSMVSIDGLKNVPMGWADIEALRVSCDRLGRDLLDLVAPTSVREAMRRAALMDLLPE